MPVATEPIRQIIADNNLSCVADVISFIAIRIATISTNYRHI